MFAIGRAKEWAKRLWEPGDTLSQRVVRSGFWAFTLRIANRLFQLIRTIVLARVLAPSDFGLMGIALLTMSALETFTQTGFQAALIQKKGNIEDYLDTAWTVSALRGFLLFAVLFLAAPYVALFFDTPAATPIMRVIGVSMLLNGLTNIGVVYFQKELEFNKQFIYQLSGTIADLVVAITAALLLRSVWALVFGLLAGNLVRFVISYLIHPCRPRVRLEGRRAKELYSFGRWVLGSSVVIFILHQGDDILVGRVMKAASLGLYQMAFLISSAPATEISHVISQITFPSYSKLQDDIAKLKRLYYITLQFVALLSIPMAGGIFVLAKEFTQLFIGSKWLPMVPAMQILSVFGATRAINSTMGPLFQGSGKPDILTRGSTYQLVLMATLIYPLILRWGIVGASIATTIANLLFLIYGIFNIVSITKHTVSELSKLVFIPVLCTVVMILAISGLKPFLSRLPNILTFVTLMIGGLVAYAISISIFERFFTYSLCKNARYLKAKIGGTR